jgi:uncharacterized heparinase superfamily protein
MSRFNVQHAIWRIQAILAKGPGHPLSLAHWYATQAIQRGRKAWRSSAVDERAFLTQLTLSYTRRDAQTGDLTAAKKTIVQHFRNRAQPVFYFDPLGAQAIAASVKDTVKEHTIARADDICRHIFHFRGELPMAFNGPVDWFHCPAGNVDWAWELNRHAYFVTLGRAYAYIGDERYVHEFRNLLLDWLNRNPVGVGERNWASVLEVAYRINVWLWAYHHFLGSPAFDDQTLLACLRGLWIHGRYLAANLERHVRNNHLLLEGKALAMCGLMFPEFKDAQVWLDRGLSTLWEQVRRQVRPDGVHGEQATMYHRVITSELLEILVLLENNGVAVPPDILNTFTRMLEFERAITKPDGRFPLCGDSALSDSYIRFSTMVGGAALLDRVDLASGPLDEATWWLVGPERARRLENLPEDSTPPSSQAFPAGGYFVMRHGKEQEQSASHLVFDCGPFGYRPVPGHGHADALSFELYAGGRTLIADPGVYSYHLGAEWRNYFRSTAAHNTVVVDGQDQSLLLGEWHVIRPARATLHQWITDQHFDFADGSHAGYTRLRQPVIHRRQIFFVRPEYWIVLDSLDGRGQHQFDLYFHLMPDAMALLDPGSGVARIQHDVGTDLVICPIRDADVRAEVVSGSLNPIQGWISRYSGEKTPAPTLRYTKTTSAPTQFGTILHPCARADETVVDVSPLAVTDEEQGRPGAKVVTGLKIEVGPWVDYFVVDRRERPSRKVFDGYVADGELVYVRTRSADGAPVRTILHRGSQLELDGAPLIANGKDGIMRKPLEPGLYAAGG